MDSPRELISFDYAIKYLLKDKGEYDIVEAFISALLATEGYPPVTIEKPVECESLQEAPDLKRSIADVIVQAADGSKYIVEIDYQFTTEFLHKSCFNTARLIVDSLKGAEAYSTIKKVFHISLIFFELPGMQGPLYHGKTILHESETRHPLDICFKLPDGREIEAGHVFPEYFVLSVPLFNGIIKREIDEWLYLMQKGRVADNFKSPCMERVAQRLNVLRMTPKEWEVYLEYRNRVLKERDYYQSAIAKGRAEGLEEGLAQGLEEGLAKGLEEGRLKGLEEGRLKGLEEGRAEALEEGEMRGLLKTAHHLKSMGFPTSQIATITGLAESVIDGL